MRGFRARCRTAWRRSAAVVARAKTARRGRRGVRESHRIDTYARRRRRDWDRPLFADNYFGAPRDMFGDLVLPRSPKRGPNLHGGRMGGARSVSAAHLPFIANAEPCGRPGLLPAAHTGRSRRMACCLPLPLFGHRRSVWERRWGFNARLSSLLVPPLARFLRRPRNCILLSPPPVFAWPIYLRMRGNCAKDDAETADGGARWNVTELPYGRHPHYLPNNKQRSRTRGADFLLK